MERVEMSCWKGHNYTAKAPLGNHITDCPFCLIEEIMKNQKEIKSYIRECPFCLIEEIEQRQKEIKKKLIILRKWIKEMV